MVSYPPPQQTQDVDSMLVQRSRRWTNVKPTLIQGIMSAGLLLITVLYNGFAMKISPIQLFRLYFFAFPICTHT